MKRGKLRTKGEHRLPLPREQVWASLNDPEILQQCIKGCESVKRVDESRFEAIFKLRIGPIKREFKADLEVNDDGAPDRYLLVANMNAGLAGEVQGEARVNLSEELSQTSLKYDAIVEFAGWFSSFGGDWLSSIAEKYMQQFISRMVVIVNDQAGENLSRS